MKAFYKTKGYFGGVGTLNNRLITKIFWALFGIITLFFLFYTPVRFIELHTETIGLSSRVSIFIFFAIAFIIAGLSWWDTNRANSQCEKTLLDSINLVKNINATDLEKQFFTMKKGFEDTFLGPNWLNYEKSLRRIKCGISPEGEITEKYYATVEAGYFFTEDLITVNGYKLPYSVHRYFPQMLIAIGLFGTFLGLVMGLMGLDFQDTSNTKSSIGILLSGIQVSFRSSLYGVAFSILLTTFQNISTGCLETKLQQLTDAIDKIFPMNTQEDGINEIFKELEKQTASIQKMSTEITEGVGNRFDTTIQNSLIPTLLNLEKVSKQMIESTEKNNLNAISSIVDNIGSIITSSTQNEMEGLRQSLSIITDKNKEMFESFNHSIGRLSDINNEQRTIMAESSTSMINMEKVNNDMAALQEKLSRVINSLDQTVNNQSQTNQDYFALMAQVKENINIQNQSNQVFENVVSQNVELSKIQHDVITNMASTSESLNRFNQDVPRTLNAITENVGQFEQISSKVNNQLLDNVYKMETAYGNINQSIAEVSASFDNSIGVLKDQVLNGLTEINESYVEIAENLQGFSHTTNIFIDEMKEYVDEQKGLHDLWSSYKHSFDALNSEINDGLSTYTNTVKQSLRDTFEQYDSSVSKILGNFNSTLDELNETIDNFHEVLQEHFNSEIA